MIVHQAERSRVCLPPESSEHCAASLVEFPPKTHGREGRMDRKCNRQRRRNSRGIIGKERRRDASLLMRFPLTGCGEHWIAEVFPTPQTPPPPLFAYTLLSPHCHIHSFTPFPPWRPHTHMLLKHKRVGCFTGGFPFTSFSSDFGLIQRQIQFIHSTSEPHLTVAFL